MTPINKLVSLVIRDDCDFADKNRCEKPASTTSLAIGLSIGIPVGLIALAVGIMYVKYFLRDRKVEKEELEFDNEETQLPDYPMDYSAYPALGSEKPGNGNFRVEAYNPLFGIPTQVLSRESLDSFSRSVAPSSPCEPAFAAYRKSKHSSAYSPSNSTNASIAYGDTHSRISLNHSRGYFPNTHIPRRTEKRNFSSSESSGSSFNFAGQGKPLPNQNPTRYPSDAKDSVSEDEMEPEPTPDQFSQIDLSLKSQTRKPQEGEEGYEATFDRMNSVYKLYFNGNSMRRPERQEEETPPVPQHMTLPNGDSVEGRTVGDLSKGSGENGVEQSEERSAGFRHSIGTQDGRYEKYI